VFLSEKDVSLLASECQMEYTDFVETYCHWVNDAGGQRLSLKEKSNFDCVFWENGCKVYPTRPLQCRTFPFWAAIVASPQAWEIAASGCRGMGKGCLHSREEIDACLSLRSSEPLITRPYAGGAK
jgi:Fe-S-cluster containining protein